MILRLRDDVSTADTDDGMILLDERAGRYWQLNRTGALVLTLLRDGAAPQHVAHTLADRHGVSWDRRPYPLPPSSSASKSRLAAPPSDF